MASAYVSWDQLEVPLWYLLGAGDREASCQAEVSFLCSIQEDGVFWGNFNSNNDAQRLALCLEKRKELIIASFKPLRQVSWFQTV